MDHRWGKRIEVDVPIRVMHPAMSRCGTGRLCNISLGGALIISSLDSNIGSRVQVSIPITSGATPYASVIDAYLVRRSGRTFAIEWMEFAPTEVIDLVRAKSLHVLQIAAGM
jgi:PilZ domain